VMNSALSRDDRNSDDDDLLVGMNNCSFQGRYDPILSSESS